MASRHTETIAVYLEASNATNAKGISAPEIAEDCDIPLVSTYRVIREERGFYPSLSPVYPQGYYYNGAKAYAEIEKQTIDALQANSLTSRAVRSVKEVNTQLEIMTPLQRELSKVILDDVNAKTILNTFKEIPEGTVWYKQALLDKFNNAEDLMSLKRTAISFLIGLERGIIVVWEKEKV